MIRSVPLMNAADSRRMTYSRQFYTAIYICAMFNIASSSDIKSLEVSKLSCLRPEHVPVEVVFKTVLSTIQCAGLFLNTTGAVVMLISKQQNGHVLCGLSDKVPMLNPCSDTASTIKVYFNQSRLPSCPGPCLMRYNFLGISYCVIHLGHLCLYQDCSDFCTSAGGEIIEMRTWADQTTLMALEGYVAIWVGANYSVSENIYRWERGGIVDDELWMPGERQNNLPCVSLFMFPQGLMGRPCHYTRECMCTVVCDG